MSIIFRLTGSSGFLYNELAFAEPNLSSYSIEQKNKTPIH
jgi:hypothetical protein